MIEPEINPHRYEELRRVMIEKYSVDTKHNKETMLDILNEELKGNITDTNIYIKLADIYEEKKQYNLAYLCMENALNYCSFNQEKIIRGMEDLKRKYPITVNPYSIVILTYNNIAYTKMCIESIRDNNTLKNYEIIIVDNASSDGTKEWIKELKGIKYILNDENLGFPIGCNQGIQIAKEDNDIFLLNNDTLVMPNAIFNLRMGLYADDMNGATGSVSNKISYAQQITESFNSVEEYYDYAGYNNIPDMSRNEYRLKLVGFSMLIRRETLRRVGLLDERFTPGNYEDDDLGLRIIRAGYRNVLCRNSFIYHYGSISFKQNMSYYNKLLKINEQKFRSKWGIAPSYSMNIRMDIIQQIDDEKRLEAINILEIGCACGGTLLGIKNKYPNAHLYGIELNKKAADIANQFINVIDGNIETDRLNFNDEFFDYIIFTDVLDHLQLPHKVLQNIHRYLKKDGRIIASIPNVRHISVISNLLQGRWIYQDADVLDRTYLRFFTFVEIIKLFQENGYKVERALGIQDSLNEEYEKNLQAIESMRIPRIEEFRHYQYIINAQKTEFKSKEDIDVIKDLIDYIEVNNKDEKSIGHILELLKEDSNLNKVIEVILLFALDKVKMFNLLSVKAYETGNYDVIIPMLQEALIIDSNGYDTLYNMSYILEQIGEYELARRYQKRLNN